MTSLPYRAIRYGLLDEIAEVIHAVQRLASEPKSEARRMRVVETFRELVDSVEACDKLGGHEDDEPGTYEGKAGWRP